MPSLDVSASSQTPVTSGLAAHVSPVSAAQAPGADEAAACIPPLVTPGSPDGEAPHDGDHNQGGARPAGLEYQRELGTEQDA